MNWSLFLCTIASIAVIITSNALLQYLEDQAQEQRDLVRRISMQREEPERTTVPLDVLADTFEKSGNVLLLGHN